ncbi:Phosphoribosyl transferase domain containing protein [Euroglyphus maynei]|uniref:Uridine 5'-monophosphate synthase n=1 Tax=Euroglyphus maynei TaxID=6958 RepID=A0A1Y3BTY1_EURMA|nr:Phosphoribosyl transferase domain containing protein [Euroglyphus maynei]
MANDNQDMNSVIRRLYECNALKFGQFKLKSGIESPVYIDLRIIISQPDLMIDLCHQYVPLMKQCRFDLICGVPYTALTMATYLSTKFGYPMIMRRKEMKQHGTKQTLEGVFQRGNRVIIIEDLISSGSSILETALALRQAGLIVTDAIVFIDREQGGIQNLKHPDIDIKVHCCIHFSELIHFLQIEGHITEEKSNKVLDWITSNHCDIPDNLHNQLALITHSSSWKSYEDRSRLCKNPLGRRLFELMAKKRSNLCVSADLTDCQSILKLADQAGPHIVMLKTHVDIIDDFNMDFARRLRDLAQNHNFILFEDRKFADIGSTVQKQYAGGLFRLSEWTDLINAHILPGPGLIEALHQEAMARSLKDGQARGCLLISHLSSQGNLMPADYAQEAYKMAIKNSDFIVGFISQAKVSADPAFIHMTPGVKIGDDKSDKLGQQYTTPEDAVQNKGADLIIVGRGIISKLDSSFEEFEANILSYKQRGYDAYINLCQ